MLATAGFRHTQAQSADQRSPVASRRAGDAKASFIGGMAARGTRVAAGGAATRRIAVGADDAAWTGAFEPPAAAKLPVKFEHLARVAAPLRGDHSAFVQANPLMVAADLTAAIPSAQSQGPLLQPALDQAAHLSCLQEPNQAYAVSEGGRSSLTLRSVSLGENSDCESLPMALIPPIGVIPGRQSSETVEEYGGGIESVAARAAEADFEGSAPGETAGRDVSSGKRRPFDVSLSYTSSKGRSLSSLRSDVDSGMGHYHRGAGAGTSPDQAAFNPLAVTAADARSESVDSLLSAGTADSTSGQGRSSVDDSDAGTRAPPQHRIERMGPPAVEGVQGQWSLTQVHPFISHSPGAMHVVSYAGHGLARMGMHYPSATVPPMQPYPSKRRRDAGAASPSPMQFRLAHDDKRALLPSVCPTLATADVGHAAAAATAVDASGSQRSSSTGSLNSLVAAVDHVTGGPAHH